MSHHDGHHHHDHHHEKAEMPFEEKLMKLLEHWIKHNDDHAKTYMKWAKEAKHHQFQNIADLIEEAAKMNLEVNKTFEQAIEMVQKNT